MKPIIRAALASASMKAQRLPTRVTGKLIRATHNSHTDAQRLDHVRDAKAATIELLQAILTAEAALTRHSQEVES